LRYTLSFYMFFTRAHKANTCTERRISVIDRILTTFGKLLALYISSCCWNLIPILVNPVQSRLEWGLSLT